MPHATNEDTTVQSTTHEVSTPLLHSQTHLLDDNSAQPRAHRRFLVASDKQLRDSFRWYTPTAQLTESAG